MNFYLLLFFTLAGQPKSVALPLIAGTVTMASCSIQAQQLAAQWANDHPKAEITSFRCIKGRKDGAA
jgi:hypothetical protein